METVHTEMSVAPAPETIPLHKDIPDQHYYRSRKGETTTRSWEIHGRSSKTETST